MKRIDIPPRNRTDLQLYELLKKGDPISLKHIDVRYRRLLLWTARQKLEDDFVVETLVQDAYLKLWQNRDCIETPIHMVCFLRYVLKRDCISYYSAPKNKFVRLQYSLERFENYQDYMAGYDPLHDIEHLLAQETEQSHFDEVKKILSFLSPKRKRLIELCLENDFRYKVIAAAMGTSTTEIYNEVEKSIDDIRKIIKGSSCKTTLEKSTETEAPGKKLTEKQVEILKKRFEEKSSFADIALQLQLPEKDVHREFLFAYQFMQKQNQTQTPQ